VHSIQRACQHYGADIAHLKANLSEDRPDGAAVHLRANLTRTDGTIAIKGPEDTPGNRLANATLIVNARVAADPARLQGIVEAALDEVADSVSARAEIRTMRSFRPAYPTPPYRIAG
jgi:hypothetical protein